MGMMLPTLVELKSHSQPYRRTIALRHADGSFEDLGRVEGDSSYVEIIKRLSSLAACHPRYIPPSELFPNIRRLPY
jgi:hypothetical protein